MIKGGGRKRTREARKEGEGLVIRAEKGLGSWRGKRKGRAWKGGKVKSGTKMRGKRGGRRIEEEAGVPVPRPRGCWLYARLKVMLKCLFFFPVESE